jgi:flavin reductase (DIM6/NTAB) family NADH-FMN oxidoreductase RutF
MSTGTAARSSISSAEFRAACALFPTGVTVITRQMRDGRPYGMTVSSFTSVSLHPPLVLVCIDRRCGFTADLSVGSPFAINVLREDQQAIAARFASAPELGRFSNIAWTAGATGVPMLQDAVGAFSCIVENVFPGGDHLIVVAAVQQVWRFSGRPLVWCDSKYHCLPARKD